MAVVSLINAGRLWTRLMTLAEIGATPAGGVDRQALSDGEIAGDVEAASLHFVGRHADETCHFPRMRREYSPTQITLESDQSVQAVRVDDDRSQAAS